MNYHKKMHTLPEDPQVKARYQFALALIREAGDLAHDYFKKRDSLTVKSKGLQDMASEADLNTETLIRERLQANFAEDAFLGEETGLSAFQPNQGIWVVDPIDGTWAFVNQENTACVNLALLRDGLPILGIVHNPFTGELYQTAEGRGSTLNGPLKKSFPT